MIHQPQTPSPCRPTAPRTLCCAACLAALFAPTPAHSAPEVTDDDVNRAVKQAIEALLAKQQTEWLLEVREKDGRRTTHPGRVLQRTGGGVKFRTSSGKVLRVSADALVSLTAPGAFAPEQTGIHQGGRTALATFALLSAGVPRTNDQIKLALQYLEEVKMPGTYARALRANVWALLLQGNLPRREKAKYRGRLHVDAKWLLEAMDPEGWYDYRQREGNRNDDVWRPPGDNSCTQFGVLGMWACANAGLELPRSYWQAVQAHWLREQHASGGWAYGRGSNEDRETMTVAGINSLYIVLDELHAQSGGLYQRFLGLRKSPEARSAEQRLLAATRKGLRWMETGMQPPGRGSWPGYRQFGLERLGLACGLKYIGGRDWYRIGAEVAVRRHWTGHLQEDPFWLLFLIYGRAPVLFNKLAVGQEASWNYYLRDLHSLCRYLTRKYERICKWQVLSLDSTEHDLMDAPILYINGSEAISFNQEQLAKLRKFCDQGGTIIGHANLCSEAFIDSFRETFTTLFRERGRQFEKLPADHPVYLAAGRSRRQAVCVPLEGLSDGTRVFIFLSTNDLAGAWHRDLTDSQQDLFDVMADIRHYAAPPHHRLPPRLRPRGFPGPPAKPVGTVKVARLRYPGRDWNANPTAWQEMDAWARHHRGITIVETKDVRPTDLQELIGFDLVHIAGRGRWAPSEETRQTLVQYVRNGGLILADAVGGDTSFRRSFLAFLNQTFQDQVSTLSPDHLIVTGQVPGGEPLTAFRPTLWALEELGGRRAPPLLTIGPPDKTGLVFCPCDLTVSMNGHYVYGLRGYEIESARRIVANILAYRLAPAPATDQS